MLKATPRSRDRRLRRPGDDVLDFERVAAGCARRGCKQTRRARRIRSAPAPARSSLSGSTWPTRRLETSARLIWNSSSTAVSVRLASRDALLHAARPDGIELGRARRRPARESAPSARVRNGCGISNVTPNAPVGALIVTGASSAGVSFGPSSASSSTRLALSPPAARNRRPARRRRAAPRRGAPATSPIKRISSAVGGSASFGGSRRRWRPRSRTSRRSADRRARLRTASPCAHRASRYRAPPPAGRHARRAPRKPWRCALCAIVGGEQRAEDRRQPFARALGEALHRGAKLRRLLDRMRRAFLFAFAQPAAALAARCAPWLTPPLSPPPPPSEVSFSTVSIDGRSLLGMVLRPNSTATCGIAPFM